MQQERGKRKRKHQGAVKKVSASADKKTPQTSDNYKSRAKYKCPPTLEPLIYKANLVINRERFNPHQTEDFTWRIEEFNSLSISIEEMQEFIGSLPNDLQEQLFLSEEFLRHIKDDSYEYWSNLDDLAAQKLNDLLIEGEISEPEYQSLIEDHFIIPEFLVEYGFYGDGYSFEKYCSDNKEKESTYNKSYFLANMNRIIFSKYRSLIKAYNNLILLKKVFSIVIDLNKNVVTQQTFDNPLLVKLNKESILQRVNIIISTKVLKDLTLTASIEVNSEGKINFTLPKWANVLQGLEINRLRTCEVCNKFFWAERKDAYACGTPHAKVRYMRLARQNWKEKGDQYVKARKKKKSNK